MINVEELKSIPKVELHCHLDGSVSYEYLKTQSDLQNTILKWDKISVDESCNSLNDYLKSFDEILKVMQTSQSLTDGVIDVVGQAKEDGVKYIELRFAPTLHTQKGLSINTILNSVCKGAEIAENHHNVITRIIVCGMKYQSNHEIIKIFKNILSSKHLQKYIVGVDLAGGENDDSMENFKDAIEYAKRNKLNITLHAGECGCIKNVFDSIKMGASRIGHGVALFKDINKIKELQHKNILLEICPKSNIQTKAINDIKDLNLKLLSTLHIPYLINTDNRTVTRTTLIQEYCYLLENKIITIGEIKRINKNAILYSFISNSERNMLINKYFCEI
ncbi:TPA: adenosine deaminase [Staphylococcus aureus]